MPKCRLKLFKCYRPKNKFSHCLLLYLLGSVVIIGARTGKVLQVICRQKTWQTCARGGAQRDHLCHKNHQGPSTAMEWQGVVEGFSRAPETYGCYYLEFIGDGDSNVHDKITTCVPYGFHCRKFHCVNHILKVSVES